MSDSLQPRRLQPIRLLHPWDSPGKNTGVGCHFLLQCMKVKSESQVTQSCPTLSHLMGCSPSGSSVHGIFQARLLEWGAIAFSHEDAKKKPTKCQEAKKRFKRRGSSGDILLNGQGFSSLLGKRRSSMEEDSKNKTVAVEREAKGTK